MLTRRVPTILRTGLSGKPPSRARTAFSVEQQMKVLIVEDSEPVRRMIKRFIRNQVDEFVECADGSEAMACYTEHHPDLVLMDLQMAEMDGFAATREIKAAFSDARVVVVSQWDSPALRTEAQKAGAESYITKMNLLPLRDILRTGRQKP